MYLKTLEIIGFKSFADRTRLDFQPGITAIVGPNGCGKSNVADAIRWVLGETSAKALRGSKMEDCIFNGTDNRKPVGMAEVSVTFSSCEQILGTEYNEVTITRRVFRSGEGQYFINRTPCRLKDIQRLFMGTGIGTSSYSLMEQGRIDQVLSSRPEDRRDIFEEASGITKFKSDKKEALRKLEQTEANLLRLSDVIREVKRQIVSLQRQAGKARRYKTLMEELRKFDVYATRDRVGSMDEELRQQDAEIAQLNETSKSLHDAIRQQDEEHGVRRRNLNQSEQQIAAMIESGAEAQSRRDRAKELIRINHERIEEFQRLSERESRDISEAQTQVEKHRHSVQALVLEIDKAVSEKDLAEKDLAAENEKLSQSEAQIDELRRLLQSLRSELVEIESQHAKLQNDLTQRDARERTDIIRRERLLAEQSQLARVVEGYKERKTRIEADGKGLEDAVRQQADVLRRLEGIRTAKADEIRALQQNASALASQAAGKQAQLELLSRDEAASEDFPTGARLLLDDSNPLHIDRQAVLGPLAGRIDVEPEYRMAAEAALRYWLDALLVTQPAAAISILKQLQSRKEGAVRLLAVDTAGASLAAVPHNAAGARLIEHVTCDASVATLMQRLLNGVLVVDSPDAIPTPIPESITYVTRNGVVATGAGAFEFCVGEAQAVNPLSRRHMISDLRNALEGIEQERAAVGQTLTALLAEGSSVGSSVEEARLGLDEQRRQLALKQGELQIVSQESDQAVSRLETVTWELRSLESQGSTQEEEKRRFADEVNRLLERRAERRTDADAKTKDLQEAEKARSALYGRVTEKRIRFSEVKQNHEHLETQREPLQSRIAELEALIHGRSEGVTSYKTSIAQLQKAIDDTQGQIETLEREVAANASKILSLRKNRDAQVAEMNGAEEALSEKRTALESVMNRKSELDVKHAESKIRRQNLTDRISSDYGLTFEQMMREAEPDWGEAGKPDRDLLETSIAEIRAKIEAMGPVNLVAIEEYQELEDRHAFLTKQQDDLVTSKQQLMDMIRKINQTTSEMFTQTFTQINENFQEMFRKLFNGGTAKLVLVNEEDVLECGIEIIARPTGKRLQSVSLLSGGERTLTAVALLFAIYLIRPSPFCVLDELDAALDESNIERFVRTLQDFVAQSQFVVITHNRRTISAAETLYGVTMQETGVSKIVSMKFSAHENKPVPVAKAVEERSEVGAEPQT